MNITKTLTKRKNWGIGILLALAIGGIIWWQNQSKQASTTPVSRQKVWQTANPVLAEDFSAIKLTGKVKSNRFAIIAPRRMGIIQDLLVDIGDTVSKGETIGYLFPEGVEGQDSATIATAAAQLAKARAEFSEAQGVATDAVSFAEKGLTETEVKLSNLQDSSRTGRTQIQQKYDEAKTIATQSFENAKRILFGSTELNNSTRKVVGNFLSAQYENDVKNLANAVEKMEQSGLYQQAEIYTHLSHVLDLFQASEILYKNAKPSGSFSQEVIEKNLKAIQTEQIRILNMRETLDDIVLQARELESTVAKTQESLDLVRSQQNLSITQASNAVEVALANYNAALVKAGHQKIIAPFGGTISARMVEVGQAVTPNTILFYMEDVATNRSGAETFEVHVSIPESWTNKVTLGDTVELKKAITGEAFQGKILRLSDQINLQTGMMMATIAVVPSDEEVVNLVHGQTIFVSLLDENSSLFSVPTLSLKKRGTDYFVWKMVDNKPVKLAVEVIAEDGEFSQIYTTELTVEDSIITNPSVSLFRVE